MEPAALDQNPRRYGRYQLAAGALFWLPTFFLFLIDRYGLSQALRLQALYYISVVVFEVPSGWFSDRIGRVATLRLAAVWWVVAQLLFLLAGPIEVAASAQVFLALGFAFLSGTDVTFHYDSLEALGRADEFDVRESRVRRNLLFATSASAVVGGALGVIDLKLPFLLSLIAVGVQVFMSTRLFEPPAQRGDGSFLTDLGAVISYLRFGLLAWLMLYVLGEVIGIHLASELAAPYLADVAGEGLNDLEWAPLLNGALVATVAFVGALAAQRAAWLGRVVGIVPALLLVALFPAAIVVGMALATSAWVLPLLATRGVQPAIASVLIAGTVGRRVARLHRATFLSLTSFVGRLGYGMVLLVLSSADSLATSLRWAAVIVAIAYVVVAITGGMVMRSEEAST